MEKETLGFCIPIQNMANFEAFRLVISSSINLLFLKSVHKLPFGGSVGMMVVSKLFINI